MSDVVVDSCVVVKWVLPEADSGLAMQLFTQVVDRGDCLRALDIALAEAINVVWAKHHRGLINLETAREFVAELLGSPVYLHPSRSRLQAAFEIAAHFDRSVYDSLFVATAHEMRLPGVTADEALWRSVHADFPNIVLLRDWR
jgi:predicted nucleic acid-binding protein